MRRTGLIFFVVAACGSSERVASERASRQAIVGGESDSGDNEVFILRLAYDNGINDLCSSTLIGQRTLLTAAHCLDPSNAGAQSVTIQASNAATEPGIDASNSYEAKQSEMHPNWDPSTLANDIGLVLLDRAPGITAKDINTTDISALGGAPAREVGYGLTGPSSGGAGVRRDVNVNIDSVASNTLTFDQSGGKPGVCGGDSGGPALHTFGDGVERIIGLTSNGNATCDGTTTDTRVDAYFAAFIQPWLTNVDAAQCSADGACLLGCTPVDPDCPAGGTSSSSSGGSAPTTAPTSPSIPTPPTTVAATKPIHGGCASSTPSALIAVLCAWLFLSQRRA